MHIIERVPIFLAKLYLDVLKMLKLKYWLVKTGLQHDS